MKEYILNETPIKTTNGFMINNIKLNLDIKDNYNFKPMDISNCNDIVLDIKECKDVLTSKIGLDFNKYYDINIVVPKNKVIEEPIYISYNFDNDDYLVAAININYEENSKADFIIKNESISFGKQLNQLKETINVSSNANGTITIINLLNRESYNFIAIEGNIEENAMIKHNIIDLDSSISISNVDINLNGDEAKHYLNSIYVGKNNDIIDINYYIKNKGLKTQNIINAKGVLFDNSKKHFKGIIDFIKGSKDSIGKEQEKCLLLSDSCISRSLPMLLCHEEDVNGSHGVSSGQIDSEKLFYLMSRGFSENEAKKLIVRAEFSEVIENVLDEDLKNKVYDYLDNVI